MKFDRKPSELFRFDYIVTDIGQSSENELALPLMRSTSLQGTSFHTSGSKQTSMWRKLMKGRRKVKTLKWHLKSTIETEAREILLGRSARQGRFLDLALLSDNDREPVGRIAG